MARVAAETPGAPGRTPLREPTTIVARPSAVAWSRVAWLVLTLLLAVTVLPLVPTWAPWMLVPLLVTAGVTGGAWSAVAWAIAGALLLDLAPPASSAPGLALVPAVAAALVVTRAARSWNSAAWVPAIVGGLGALTASLVVLALRVVASGSVQVDPYSLLGSTATTAVLTAALAPTWVRWTLREQERGRA
ncbi:hypothetical protein AA983_06050 [Dermacoccus sp. PE3]|nr:hypothetical protein AA983_06050 [Dermacoccus sp. PE3]